MVGKSRGTVSGKTRSTTGSSPGGGTVGAPSAEELQQTGQDIIDDALQAHPEERDRLRRHETEAHWANLESIPGTRPDLTGRGTPAEPIAPEAIGTPEERLETCHTPEDALGMGAGGHSNLGVKHGRTPKGGEIAGSGAAIQPRRTQKKESHDA